MEKDGKAPELANTAVIKVVNALLVAVLIKKTLDMSPNHRKMTFFGISIRIFWSVITSSVEF